MTSPLAGRYLVTVYAGMTFSSPIRSTRSMTPDEARAWVEAIAIADTFVRMTAVIEPDFAISFDTDNGPQMWYFEAR